VVLTDWNPITTVVLTDILLESCYNRCFWL